MTTETNMQKVQADRYIVRYGEFDQFGHVCNWRVIMDAGIIVAICRNEADAKKVAAALNAFDPLLDEPPA